MPDIDRNVAGIRCRTVLERLSDYLDGDVSPDEKARIDAHLRSCDWCERFGGSFAEVVGALRRELGRAPDLSDDVEARLKARLARSG